MTCESTKLHFATKALALERLAEITLHPRGDLPYHVKRVIECDWCDEYVLTSKEPKTIPVCPRSRRSRRNQPRR
jgi:hypothetical protein